MLFSDVFVSPRHSCAISDLMRMFLIARHKLIELSVPSYILFQPSNESMERLQFKLKA